MITSMCFEATYQFELDYIETVMYVLELEKKFIARTVRML